MPESVRPGNSRRIIVAISMHMRSAIGRTAFEEYPPGVVYPSTVGSGRNVSRFTPVTLRIVLIALTPWQPARNAARVGSSMRVMLGVIFAQTGFVAAPHDPTADLLQHLRILPHRRAHLALGQTVRTREVQFEGIHARRLATLDDLDPRVRVELLHDGGDQHAAGKRSLQRLNSSSQISNGRSLMSSMFSQPMTSARSADRVSRSAG